MKTMKWSFMGIVAIAATLMIGCSAPVHIEKDDNADFTQYKSFAWADRDGEGRRDRNRTNDLMEQRFKDAVTKELVKQGWRTDNRRPDLLISYDVVVDNSIRDRNEPVYSRSFTRTYYNPYSRRYYNVYYPSQFMGYDNYSEEIREGTITITVTDAKTDRVVWQGWTTDEVNSRNLTSKEINSAVKSIFRKFDVARR